MQIISQELEFKLNPNEQAVHTVAELQEAHPKGQFTHSVETGSKVNPL